MSQPTLPGIVPVAAPEIITIEVKCIPKGQPRLKSRVVVGKHGNNAGRAFAQHYTPDTADAFKTAIQIAAGRIRDRRHEGPVHLTAVCFFPRTEKVWRKNPRTKVQELVEINHVPADAPDEPLPMWGKPDRDNLDKAILDALGDIGVFAIGDEQICGGGGVQKWWAAKGSAAGVRIVIEFMPVPEWAGAKKRRSS